MGRVDSFSARGGPTVALIAHDERKAVLRDLCRRHRDILARCRLIATGTSGRQVAEATGLRVTCYLAGPDGGDVQIAARVVLGEVAAVIFLVDPSHPHPHEPDIQSLWRACNVHNVPLAINPSTAECVVRSIARGLAKGRGATAHLRR
jgi:methylglyoxal synthase